MTNPTTTPKIDYPLWILLSLGILIVVEIVVGTSVARWMSPTESNPTAVSK